MAAAPQYAILTFRQLDDDGNPTDQTLIKEAYLSDVANAVVRFDSGAGAGTGSKDNFKADDNYVLEDFAIATGMTDTTRVQVTINGKVTGDILRYAPFVNTINNRPRPNVVVAQDEEFGMIQLA